jgi:hypothetical protein
VLLIGWLVSDDLAHDVLEGGCEASVLAGA